MDNTKTQPKIQSFRINGLHGYKNVVLDFAADARIVIAENGMGKTTILSALNAFLSADFSKLQTLSFDSIECKLDSDKDSPVLHKKNLSFQLDPEAEKILRQLSKYSVVNETKIKNVIFQAQIDENYDVTSNRIFHEIYRDSPLSKDQMLEYLQTIQSSMHLNESSELQELIGSIKSITKEINLLYLPTYRRIEVPYKGFSSKMHHPRSLIRRRYQQNPHMQELTELGIQFGLADVENQLTELFYLIQRQSSVEYRAISANIIDDLLEGNFGESNVAQNVPLPKIDSIDRFFSRVKSSRPQKKRFDSLRELYETEEIFDQTYINLRYFLIKLAGVVNRTEKLEANIEEFVDKANSYLTTSSDEKILEYDSDAMRVLVRNSITENEIDLDDLSSGEKQVISLLARLYLYDKKKFVMIDEPELSLSIDWQKRLLPDILNSPSCSQLLAITHSPFIFDNELDPYAGPLNITRTEKRAKIKGKASSDDR